MIDLHCHTDSSDGILTPADLVIRASKEGVKAVAIADHDTIQGISSAIQIAESHGVRIIPAVEISIDYKGGDFHLLGYGFDTANTALIRTLNEVQTSRKNRIPIIVENLAAIGVPITVDDVMRECAGSSPGKPHVARALVQIGAASSFDDAFDKFLSDGKAGSAPKKKISQREGITLIRDAGGISVCAHPASLGISGAELLSFLRTIRAGGVCGIEAYASMHSDEEVSMYCGIAKKEGFIITGGSDFHGDKNERIGYYGSGRIIPESCLDDLDSIMAVK